MKRQENELFFKYKAHAKQLSPNNISFDLPDGFIPQVGDIMEMLISENSSIGVVSHYVKSVYYIDATSETSATGLASIDGRLANVDGNFDSLIAAYYSESGGKRYIDCYGPDTSHIDFDNQYSYIVNLIVHRTVGQVELYNI